MIKLKKKKKKVECLEKLGMTSKFSAVVNLFCSPEDCLSRSTIWLCTFDFHFAPIASAVSVSRL